MTLDLIHPFPIRIKYSEDKRFVNGPHLHSLYEILYLHEGKCTFVFGSNVSDFQPGDLVLLNGLTLHNVNFDHQFPYRRHTLHFDADFIKNAASSVPFDILKPFHAKGNPILRLSASERSIVEEKIKTLEWLYGQHHRIALNRIYALFMEFLMFIYDICERRRNMKDHFPTHHEKITHDILRYIDHHYRKEIKLKMLENEFHLDKNHLSKIFFETTGIRITDYLHHRRINQARVMLSSKNKKRSILSIAFETGFKSHSHFYRVFKRLTGFTPHQYRKLYAQSNSSTSM